MAKKILEKLVAPLIIVGSIGLAGIGGYVGTEVVEANGGKTMDKIFPNPHTIVYDTNRDGTVDKSVDFLIGTNGKYLVFTRDPTQEEISLYLSE